MPSASEVEARIKRLGFGAADAVTLADHFLDAEGRGKLSRWPMRVPIRLSAKAITGVGDVAGAMLANPRIEGWLAITPKLVRGDGLKLTSAKSSWS